MKIIQIAKENREYFLNVDPLMMMEYLEYPDTFGLAVTMEDEDSKKDIPAALAIITMRPDNLMINWMCVEEEYRMKGIGEKLLEKIFEIAEKTNRTTISAYFNEQFGRDMICKGEEEYFRERLFEMEEEVPGEWFTNLEILSKMPQWKYEIKHSRKVIPISKLSSYKLREAMELVPDLEVPASLFEQELSAVLYDGDRVCGILLVQYVQVEYYDIEKENLLKRTRNILCPVYLQTESVKDSLILTKEMVNLAKEKYPLETEIHIIVKNKVHLPLLNDLPPYTRVGGKILTAFVEDYSRQRELEEMLLEFERLGIELD